MKKLIVVLLMWCTGCTVVRVENPVITKSESPIKIDYMTMGENAPDSLYLKETCFDPKVKIVQFPTSPEFKNVRGSIQVLFHFEFESNTDTCFAQVTTLLEILDKELNVVAQKTVYVSQFESAIRYHLFFKDRSFDSGDYFIQFKFSTGNEDYVSTLAQLPSRFKS